MIYRLLMISFVAFVILGVSSVFYDHYIDVRDTEAALMTRQIVDCVAPEGVLNLDSLSKDEKKNILLYCGFEELEVERFFARVTVNDSSGKVDQLSHGDSGALVGFANF